MLTKTELASLPFASYLASDSILALEKLAAKSSYINKTELIEKGDIVNGAYLVTDGRLRIYNMDPDGNQKTIYYVQEGEACLLAMNCVFSDLLYPAWVSTDTKDCRIIMIPGKLYKKLNETEKTVREFTFNTLSARIFDLMSRLEEVSAFNLDQRLANFLIKRANSDNKLIITHQEIAIHLGTAREVVSRILKSFERQNLLNLTRGEIIINSVQKLAKYDFK